MKHIFVINPMAGDGTRISKLKDKVASIENAEIYETKSAGDATTFIKEYLTNHTDEVRFYSCGGDGTMKEVAEGIVGHPHASMSVYPIGSGNDFVKYFGGADKFLNLDELINAPDVKADIIHIKTEEGAEAYSLNVCNFGFEAYAASVMGKVRRKPIIGGKNAYTAGVVAGLFKAMKTKGKIYLDGELVNESGVYILGAAANGGYVGGGYHCAPLADIADGLLEVSVIRPISVFTLAKLIGVYKAGKHLEDERFKKYLTYRRAKCVEVIGEKKFPICLDGEIIYTKHFTASTQSSAIRFAVPGLKTKQKV